MRVTKLLAGDDLSCVLLNCYTDSKIKTRICQINNLHADWFGPPGPERFVHMALKLIWNLRADSAWIELVKVQAIETGRSSPGAFVRDLVWAMSKNPTIKNTIFEAMQGVRYGQSR